MVWSVDLVDETVAAQQVAVAFNGIDLPQIDGDLGFDAERPRDDVAVRMNAGFGCGDLARRRPVR